MLPRVVEDQPHSAFAHFRGKLVRGLAHDAPSYSRVGASGKPGAVHKVNPPCSEIWNNTEEKQRRTIYKIFCKFFVEVVNFFTE
jgi:hypothetical protein